MKRALLAVLVAMSCGERIEENAEHDRTGGVVSVRVTVTGERGARERPLPFSAEGAPLTLAVEVLGAEGQRLTDFNGYMALSVTPGTLASIEGGNAVGNLVRLTAGRVEGVAVRIARSYGEARLWAEDAGYVPVDPRRVPAPECADGVDNDDDGRADYPGDTGCEALNDDSERAGSFAAGASEPMYFATPLIADVQGRTALSPLVDQRVTIAGTATPEAPAMASRAHRLVVIQTDNSGFYVSDIDDRSCEGSACFNSLYSFNFRTPEGMRPCDLLTVLTGSVAEFVSSTQLAQPGFQVGVAWRPDDPAVGPCLIPEAVVLRAPVVRDPAVMERYESGLVRVVDARLPTMMGAGRAPQGMPAEGATNCDLDGDGRVTFGGSQEGVCANACAADPTCSEWSAWARFGQVALAVMGAEGEGMARVAMAPRAVSPSFNPLRPTGPTVTVTGTLRQVGPNWIIQPRCEQDLVVAGDGRSVRPTNASCLHERTIGEE
jgi:hypothetical protein